jgi:hypothetical protein
MFNFLKTRFATKAKTLRNSGFRPQFDALEDRQLMAVAVFAGGILNIIGTDGPDTITVRQRNSTISIDGLAQTFTTATVPLGGPPAQFLPGVAPQGTDIVINAKFPLFVQAIVVNGLGGSDTINLDTAGTSGGVTYVPITVSTALRGGAGNDTVYGGAGRDFLFGEADVDKLYGRGGNDRLEGGAGDDTLYGGADSDVYAFVGGTLGTDSIEEPATNAASDRLDFSQFVAAVNVNLALTTNQTVLANNLVLKLSNDTLIEEVFGSGFDDTIQGNSLDNVINGLAGKDSLFGHDGNDILRGGTGRDTLFGGSGRDFLAGGSNDDTLDGGSNDDALFGGTGVDGIIGASGDDRFLALKDTPGMFGGMWDPDVIVDLQSNDARINFENGNGATTHFYGETQTWSGGSWTDAEIEEIDLGFGILNLKTENTKLLKKSDGGEMNFVRQGSQTNVTDFKAGAWNGGGTITMIDVSFAQTEDELVTFVLHEIGHNWDEENPNYKDFKTRSGWRTFLPWENTAGWTQSTLDPDWYFLSIQADTFVSGYAATNPKEDFAESFAAFFMNFAGRSHSYNLSAAAGKLVLIGDWVDTL